MMTKEVARPEQQGAAPEPLSETDKEYWLARRPQIIDALSAEGYKIWSDKERVWLHRIRGAAPVAWMYTVPDGNGGASFTCNRWHPDRTAGWKETPLYAAPIEGAAEPSVHSAGLIVREGWKLVPIAPTHEMCLAGNDCQEADPVDGPYAAAYEIYKAMLAAAPTIEATRERPSPQTAGQDDKGDLLMTLSSKPDALPPLLSPDELPAERSTEFLRWWHDKGRNVSTDAISAEKGYEAGRRDALLALSSKVGDRALREALADVDRCHGYLEDGMQGASNILHDATEDLIRTVRGFVASYCQASDETKAEAEMTDPQSQAPSLREALADMLRYFDKPRRDEWCNAVEWRRAAAACEHARTVLSSASGIAAEATNPTKG